jgi:hypothetical protein
MPSQSKTRRPSWIPSAAAIVFMISDRKPILPAAKYFQQY